MIEQLLVNENKMVVLLQCCYSVLGGADSTKLNLWCLLTLEPPGSCVDKAINGTVTASRRVCRIAGGWGLVRCVPHGA